MSGIALHPSGFMHVQYRLRVDPLCTLVIWLGGVSCPRNSILVINLLHSCHAAMSIESESGGRIISLSSV